MSATTTPPIATETSSARSLDRRVRTRWEYYRVWKRNMPDNACPTSWAMTSHTLKARTDKEAQSKLRRMFFGCGFHAMSLVAVLSGESPNTELSSERAAEQQQQKEAESRRPLK